MGLKNIAVEETSNLQSIQRTDAYLLFVVSLVIMMIGIYRVMFFITIMLYLGSKHPLIYRWRQVKLSSGRPLLPLPSLIARDSVSISPQSFKGLLIIHICVICKPD